MPRSDESAATGRDAPRWPWVRPIDPRAAALRVLLVQGINLSQLAVRDPRFYGTQSLEDILADLSGEHPALEAFASEHEGAIVERLHAARTDGTAGLLINPGAHTHYSYGIRDALELLSLPKAEVHLSNTASRDAFRRHSTITPVVDVSVTGLGALGYRLALGIVVELALDRR